MSSFRSEYISTQIITPVLSNDQRCIFRIPNLICVKKSFALADVQYSGGAGGLTMIGGISNLIKNISLRVGGTQIDHNNFVAVTNTLQNLRSSTTKALNVDKINKKNALDFKQALVAAAPVTGEFIVASNFDVQARNTAGGLLYLHEFLKFFNAEHNLDAPQEFLPLNLFGNANIELTIEWQNNGAIVSNSPNAVTGINPPTLCVDCLDTSSPVYQALPTSATLTYNRWEVETLNYPAPATAGASVQVRERLSQPSNKYVTRLCVLTQSNEVTDDLGTVTKSRALPAERYQLVLNGQQVLDFRSEDDAEKVMHFVNAWGDYILPPGGRYYEWAQAGNVTTKNSIVAAVTPSPIVSNASLFGVNIQQRVNYLELDFQYSDDPTTPVTDGGNINVIYEVSNAVNISNGTFRVVF